MKVVKLSNLFYDENKHLVEVLDKDVRTGEWYENKVRGYGIVLVEILGLKFGIPLRSKIHHNECFKVDKDGLTENVKTGLDFSKAILLDKEEYIFNTYKIPLLQLNVLRDKEYIIGTKFKKYVNKYIKAVKKQDEHKLKTYKFSTLQNYHTELNI
jgi:protein AbiQ